jgi:DNA modification methylase
MSYQVHNAEFVSWAADEDYRISFEGAPKYHAVLCDPPYGISFMGKKWDDVGGPQAFQAQATGWGKALLPLLYPGALVFMFGGTRMWHRLAAGMEDAGFYLWDTLMWLYGQGFPKAQDISKLIDRKNGDEREVIEQRRFKGGGTEYINRNNAAQGFRPGEYQKGENIVDITAPGSELSAPWSGHKTPQLKPAWEPVLCFRAPNDGKKYAELALEYGSGCLNIDAGRIETFAKSFEDTREVKTNDVYGRYNPTDYDGSKGRFPANVALDDASAAMLHEHSAASRFFYCAKASRAEREAGLDDFQTLEGQKYGSIRTSRGNGYPDATSIRNSHPTVKPIDLNRWLATLLLPPESVKPRRILVPFAGVGSEMIGAMLAGWDEVVGVEMSPEFCKIAEARLAHWANKN